MKAFRALLAFALFAAVCASPFFHGHTRQRHHYAYYPVEVRRYVHVPEVHVQKVVHAVPVPYVAPVYHPVPVPVRSDVVQTAVGGSVNVAANPGAVHVTKTYPTVVSVV